MKAIRFTALVVVVPLLVSACVVQQPANYMSPEQRQLAALATCKEHIVSEPTTPEEWPAVTRSSQMGAFDAAVVITYELDGTGTAKNAKVVDSRPKGLFDATALRRLEATRFGPGVTPNCTYVRTYSKQRSRM